MFSKELLFSALAFGFFVVCPRMAGMMHIINKHSGASLILTVILGVVVSIPILLCMVFVFQHWGVWGALGVCVLTDVCAALIMSDISFKAGFETLVIAFFVIIGVKLAPLFSSLIFK